MSLINLSSKSGKVDPLLVLEPSEVESLAFFNSIQKYPQNVSAEESLTLNDVDDGSNFNTITGSFNQQIGQSLKDIFVVGPDGDNVDINRLYFLVTSEDNHSTVNVENISSVNSIAFPQEQEINVKSEPFITVIDNKQNEDQNCEEKSERVEIDLFDDNESLQTTKFHRESLVSVSQGSSKSPVVNVIDSKESFSTNNENILSIEDRLSKRDSLLPKKNCRRNSKRNITCDKCKTVFNSSSQYYSHRNVHMQKQKGEEIAWSCAQCGKVFEDSNDLESHELQEHGEVRKYPCPHCIHSFPKLLLLDYHIRSAHRGEKQFKCKLCGHKFFRSHDLKMHLNIHFDIKSHVCHFCGRQFNHPSNLLRHQRTHTNVKPYLCTLCGRRFSQIPSLLAHQVSHTSGGSCSECNATFRSIAGLRNHMKNIHKKTVHSKELYRIFYKTSQDKLYRLYNCVICAERFRFKKGLEIHEMKAHSNKSFPCKSCFKVLPYINDFKSHPCIKRELNFSLKTAEQPKLPPNTYQCINCHKYFKSFEDSEKHVCKLKLLTDIIPSEETKEIEEISITKEELYDETVEMYINTDEDGRPIPSLPCSASNKVNEGISSANCVSSNSGFVSDENIKTEHEKICSSFSTQSLKKTKTKRRKQEQKKGLESGLDREKLKRWRKSNLKENIKSKRSSHKIFECTQCWKTFTKSWNWRQHIGIHDASLRRYVCVECGLSFSYRSTYTNHLKTHSKTNLNEKFPCSKCPKTYKTKTALDQHTKRVHDKQLNYLCNLCSKGFYNKSEYSYHMRIHKKECPYVCFTCGKGFSHVSHLHRHERIHTGEKPHKCPCCSKSFIQLVTFRIHLKKHEEIKSVLVKKEEIEEPVCIAANEVVDMENEAEKDMAVISLEEMAVLTPQVDDCVLKKKELTEYSIDISG